MRWYAQASHSVFKTTNENRFSHHYLSTETEWSVCVSQFACFVHIVCTGQNRSTKAAQIQLLLLLLLYAVYFFSFTTQIFFIVFMCAKQQSTVLFFFRMHVDNAKERCVSINIVIYYLLNTFKWQNSRKTVLFLLLICKLKMQRVFLVSFFSFVLCDFGPVFHVQCTKLKIAFVKFLPNAPSTRQYHGVCTNIRLNIDEWNKTQLYRA